MRERPILFSGPMVRAILAGAESHAHAVAKDWLEYASLAKAGRKRRLPGG